VAKQGVAAPEAASGTSTELVVLTEADGEIRGGVAAAAALAGYHRALNQDGNQICAAMASSCGDSEGCTGDPVCPSQLPLAGCSSLLHELSNLVTGVLLNAQVLEWKLPPYSHLKRPVREVARNAQRSSELLKRLVHLCAEADRQAEPQSCSNGVNARLAQPWSGPRATPTLPTVSGAPARPPVDLTTGCDIRTSHVFPKRDDRYEH
jgi:hypothetical protein